MASNSILFDAVFEDDVERLCMGRFNEAEEREMERIIGGKGGPLRYILGRRAHIVDFTRPGLFSTRPRTQDGGHTFSFQHKTISKFYERDLRLKHRQYLQVEVAGCGEELRASGAKFAKSVFVKGKREGWWVPRDVPAPPGTRIADPSYVIAKPTGEQPGTAARRQSYIEREPAVEGLNEAADMPSSTGIIADSLERRVAFWQALEERERADGRVQNQIIAELPFEPEIGPIGRFQIVERFGRVFDEMGLLWHGCVHKPDKHSDPRNYHMHLLFSERPAVRSEYGWRFADRKAAETRSREFVGTLRQKFADAVNVQLEAAGLDRRYDPRSYAEMGIDKEPGEHLGVSAAALERKGIVTWKGRRNVAREMLFRLRSGMITTMDALASDTGQLERLTEVVREAAQIPSPRVHRAAERVGDAVECYATAVEEHRRRQAHAMVASWRAGDVLRRPKSAAQYSDDDNVRVQAKSVADVLRVWCREERERASQNLLAARRARARAEVGLNRAERNLHGERLLAARGYVLAGIEISFDKLTDRRLSEAEWREKAQSLRNRRSSAEKERDRARRAIVALLNPLGRKAAREKLCELEHPPQRGKALADLRADPSIQHDLIEAELSALISAQEELMPVEGEERQYRRVETNDDLRRRRVRSEQEEEKLILEIEHWASELRRIDEDILSDRFAREIAEQGGIAERIGREAETVETKLRTWQSRSKEMSALDPNIRWTSEGTTRGSNNAVQANDPPMAPAPRISEKGPAERKSPDLGEDREKSPRLKGRARKERRTSDKPKGWSR